MKPKQKWHCWLCDKLNCNVNQPLHDKMFELWKKENKESTNRFLGFNLLAYAILSESEINKMFGGYVALMGGDFVEAAAKILARRGIPK